MNPCMGAASFSILGARRRHATHRWAIRRSWGRGDLRPGVGRPQKKGSGRGGEAGGHGMVVGIWMDHGNPWTIFLNYDVIIYFLL